jgi:hypothetical protein
MKNNIIEELYTQKEIKTLCKNFCRIKNLSDDLHQELFEILMRMPESNLIDIRQRGEIEIFIKGILRNMVSKTGQFNKKFILPQRQKVDHIRKDEDGNETSIMDDLLSCEISDYIYEGMSKETKHLFLEAMEKVLNTDAISDFDKRILNARLKQSSNLNTAKAEKINERFVHESLRRSKKILKEKIEKEMQ